MQPEGRLMQGRLWQALTRFDRTKIAPGVAFRNTVGIVAPVAIASALGNPTAGVVVALGALNVSYSDSQEPYGTRARRMLLASALVGLAVYAGALSAKSNLTAVAVAALWAFGAGMMPALGQRAGDLGSITLVTLVVFAVRRLTPLEAVESGMLAAAGGVLQTILSVAFWPVHRHEPERRIIGALYGTLANLAILPAGQDAAPPATAQITETQEMLSTLAGSQDEEAERYILLLNQAERIRLALLTLRRLRKRIERDTEGGAAVQALDRILAVAAAQLESIANGVVRGSDVFLTEEFSDCIRAFKSLKVAADSALLTAAIRDARHQIDALAGQLRAAAHPGSLGPRHVEQQADTIDRWARVAQLRANLSFRSTTFRHAVRLAVCVGLGDAIGRAIDLERTYWIPMTTAIVLRPDFTATFSRGILRIAGTLAGLLLATGLFHWLAAGRTTEIVLLAIFVFLLRWVGPANYGVFVTALSAFIVVFIAITGVSPAAVIQARAVNTILGGAIALVAYGVWPTWESRRAGPVFADLLDAYKAYFQTVMDAYRKQDAHTADELYRMRMKARLARSNAEAFIGRIVAEPALPRERAILLSAMLVASHGFVRAALAIESMLDRPRSMPPRPATVDFAAAVGKTLASMAGALRSGSRLPADMPDLRERHDAIVAATSVPTEQYTLINTETDRIATSLNTLREQLAKYVSGTSSGSTAGAYVVHDAQDPDVKPTPDKG
jgi:uncharacterized membrane protein YccC